MRQRKSTGFRNSVFRNSAGVAILSALIPAMAFSDTLNVATVSVENDRLGQQLEKLQLGENDAGLAVAHEGVTRALEQGMPHWAFYRLQNCLNLSDAFEYRAEGVDRITDMEAFEKHWHDRAQIPELAHAASQDPACRNAPNLIRAIVEVATNRAGGYYHGSIGQARSTQASDGLFYLGRAEAFLKSVQLCKTFAGDAPSEGSVDPNRDFGDALRELEGATLAAYDDPQLAMDRNGEFAYLNSIFKEIRELDKNGLRLGALERTLEANLQLGKLTTKAPKSTHEALAKRLAGLNENLSAAGGDPSLGLALLERAASALDDSKRAAESEDDTDNPEDGLITAEQIVDRVLPVYIEWMGIKTQ